MREFLERLADAFTRHLLGWLHRRVEPGSREWLDALMAESQCADDAWQRLRWALGGIPLVFTTNRRSQVKAPVRITARAPIISLVANIAAVAGCYAVIIPATYVAARILHCDLSFGSQPGGCQEHPLVFASIAICGGALGVILALVLRASFAAYWWAAYSAFYLVGSLWYLRSGIADLPRYGSTQSAMLLAATFGVALVAIMREMSSTNDGHDPNHRAIGNDAAPSFFLSRHRITDYLVAGTISFAAADVLTLLRNRNLVAGDVNHLAVLASAIFAAILAGLIGRHASQFSPKSTIAEARL